MENRPASEGPTQPMTPPVEKASAVEDFVDIFYAPASVFARREKAGYGLQLLVVVALSALFAFANRGVMSQIFDVEYQRGIAKAMAANPQITAEQIASMRPMQEGIATFAGYIGTPIFIFILAFFAWLVAKAVSAKFTYQQAVLIVTLAWIPRLLGSLVMTLQAVLMDTSNVTNMFSLSLSAARFMDPDATNPKLFGLLGSFEPFSLWAAILTGIGISVIGKVPRSRGYTAAAIMFALGTLPLLLR